MISISTFKDMVEKLNIYEPLRFELVKISKEELVVNSKVHNQIQKILFFENKRVVTKCPMCNLENTFYVYKTDVSYGNNNNNEQNFGRFVYAEYHPDSFLKTIDLGSCILEDLVVEKLYNIDYYVNYLLRCSNNYSHVQLITLRIMLNEGKLTIVKVGQDPINTDLVNSEAKIYEKQLRKFNAEEDFKNSIRSKDRNLYAGAVTYLRRIYEKIVDFYLLKVGFDSTSKRMKEKLEAINEYLDKDFYNISKNLYSLLSKGIHELNEEEILNMFGTLYGAVMFQLDFEKNNDDSKAKKADINKNINALIQKHN